MQNTDLLILLIFSLIVFATGMSFSSSNKDMKSFFAAGGAVPWWINGLSLFMSFFSAGTFVVWGSIAYTDGVVSLSIQWTMAIAGLFIGLFIAARWRKTQALTVAEYLTKRFGYHTQRVYTYLFLSIAIFTTGGFLYPVAKIVEVSTGFDLHLSIIALGILIALYTATGGLWAVIVTDVLQFVVLTAAVLIVVPLALEEVGGWQTFTQTVPSDFFSLVNAEYTGGFLLAFGLYNLVFIGGNWAYVQRYTSVSTPHNARKVGWLFGGLYIISPVIWMLPPMLYRGVEGELSGLASEGAYLLMCKLVMPAGLLGLVLGGMVFATASSVNTTLNISAGVLTNDIYKHFFPHGSDKQTMIFARLATLGFGLFTIVVALLVPLMGGIVEVVMTVAAITGGAMYLPPIWSLFSKRQTGTSLLAATLISLIINSFFKFLAPSLLDISLSRAMEMGLGVGLPVVVLLLSEFILKPQPQPNSGVSQIPEAEEDEAQKDAEESQNAAGVRKIGWGVLAIGLLMLGLALTIAETDIYTLTVALLISALGSWLASKKSKSQIEDNHDSR